jgi:hypothetical protein
LTAVHGGTRFADKETGMSTIHDDLIERSVNIHWPDGYDPGNADLFAHNTIVIDVPARNI